jgi:rhodanese-related sulfurtransferase/uncharacterized membrane protein YphA (DoxX/SURF4 family)
MGTVRLELKWTGAGLLIIISAVIALLYNSFGGIPLIAVNNPTALVRGTGLPDEDGIHLVGLDAARTFFEEGRGAIVDARTPEQYDEGHIPGAFSCYVYELETYLPPLLEKLTLETPLLIYCTGADCEDSQFLAQTMQELGFKRIYIYEGGFDGWRNAGLEVETGSTHESGTSREMTVKYAVDFGRYIPVWAWIAGEFALLGYGLLVLGLVLTGRQTGLLTGISLRLVGVVFILASLHKIVSPEQFAAVVDNYRILPPWLVNIPAIIMPWLELIAGIILLSGRCRGQSALVLAGLTLVFILAISYNMARGVEFDCGCFGSGHTPPWRVLLRDVGLLLCCIPALIVRKAAQNA